MNTKRLSRRINRYTESFVGALLKGNVEAPGAGDDCWHCGMRTVKENVPWGEAVKDTGHLLSHMEEPYYVPSLLARAVEVFPVSKAAMWVLGDLWHDHDGKAVALFGDPAKKQLKQSLRRYMRKQFGLVKTWRRWTDEDDALLVKMAGEGIPAEKIAKRLTRSANAVYARLRRHGLPLRMDGKWWSDEEEATLRSLAAETLSAPAIAARMGRSACAIHARAFKLGIHTAYRWEYSKRELELLRELGPTHTPREMAEHLPGRSVCAIRGKARRMNIKLKDGRRDGYVIRSGFLGGARSSNRHHSALGAEHTQSVPVQ